jgi:hypothetical protein
MDESNGSRAWWGKHSVVKDGAVYWRVGPLDIWLSYSKKEWRIGTRTHDDPADASLVINRREDSFPQSNEKIEWRRVGFKSAAQTIELVPALAERPLVVRPETLFIIPAKETATLYISSPLWIQFGLGQPVTNLFEIPVFRPSDTWFGSSTIEGELCYALRTRARMRPEDLDLLPHRAYTECHILNRAKSALTLERLRVPMRYLRLFAAADGRLWTETVTLERRESGDTAALQLGKAPPKAVHPAQPLTEPRGKPEKGGLIRAFSGIFE